MTSMGPHCFTRFQNALQHDADVVKRVYIPKGSRTHVSVVTAHSGAALHQLGVPHRLKTGGSGGDGGLPVVLEGMIATNARDGMCLTRRTAVCDDDDVLWESVALPSRQRIGCIQLSPESREAMNQAGSGAATFPSPVLHVADVLGNVYLATLPPESTCAVAMGSSESAPKKRQRREPDDSGVSFWRLITPAKPCDGGNTYGTRGWCGLTSVDNSHLLCCREFFFDLRLLDIETGAVVSECSTMHAPTGTTTCSSISPHCVVVAEGPLATVYDLRCPATALVVGKGARSEQPHLVSCLTNPAACVADVCHTHGEHEIAAAVGRSLCIHDVRKWSRTGITTNVLKYNIGSIAPFASGRAVVAAGIDAEVRIVSLCKTGAAATPTALCGRNVDDARDAEPAAMSFRNRIDSVVSCMSTWHGGWVPSVDGMCATGVSVDHEVFLSHEAVPTSLGD